MTQATRADVCAIALAECFRYGGEIMASPMGTIPTLGARLAKATFAPDLLITDGANKILREALPLGSAPRPDQIEGYLPFCAVFDTLWWGKRHVIMGATQIDQHGNQNIACIGDWNKPKVQLLGVRGAPGNTINHATSYWVPKHSTRVFVPKVDVVSGVGYDRIAELSLASRHFHHIHRVVSNLGVFDFHAEHHRMQLLSLHPGVSVDEVKKNTGFELVIADNLATSRAPSTAELAELRRLDPQGLAQQEVVS
jgi:acyl CoA:acetate/3-ketoacid CoA transferase beta subunit